MNRGPSGELITPKIQLFNPNVVKVEKILQRVRNTLTNFLLPSVQTDFINTTYSQLIETIPPAEDPDASFDPFWESWVPFREDAIQVCSQSVIEYSVDYVNECFDEINKILDEIAKMPTDGIATKRTIDENVQKIIKITSGIKTLLDTQYESELDTKQQLKNLLNQRTKIRHYKTDIANKYTSFFDSIQRSSSQKRMVEIVENIFKNINCLPEQEKCMRNIQVDLSNAELQLYHLYKPRNVKIELLRIKKPSKLSASNPSILVEEVDSEEDAEDDPQYYNTTDVPERIGKTRNFVSDSDTEATTSPNTTPIKLRSTRKHFGTDDYNEIKLGVNQSPKPSPHFDSINEYEIEEDVLEEELNSLDRSRLSSGLQSLDDSKIENISERDLQEQESDILADNYSTYNLKEPSSVTEDKPPYIPPLMTPDILKSKPKQQKMFRTPQPQDSIQPLDLSQEKVGLELELSDDDDDIEQKLASNNISKKYKKNINMTAKAITPNANRTKNKQKQKQNRSKLVEQDTFETFNTQEDSLQQKSDDSKNYEKIIEELKEQLKQKDEDYETLRVQLEMSFDENRELTEQNKKLEAKLLSQQEVKIDQLKVPEESGSEYSDDDDNIEKELRIKVDVLEKERHELLKNIEQMTEENEKLVTMTKQMQVHNDRSAEDKDRIRLLEEMQQILLAEVARCRRGQEANVSDVLAALSATREENLLLKTQKAKLLNDKGFKNIDTMLSENQRLIDENAELRKKIGTLKLQTGKNPGTFENLRRALLSSLMNEINLRMQMQLMAIAKVETNGNNKLEELKKDFEQTVKWGNEQQKQAQLESSRADINEKQIRDFKEKLVKAAKQKGVSVDNMDSLEMLDVLLK